MKELEALKQEPIEIREEQQQKKEIRFIGSQRSVPGHTLFEYNYKTNELQKAKFKIDTLEIKSLSIDHLQLNHKKVIVNENCYYLQALNQKNALKKLIKIGLLKPLTP